MSAPLLLGLSGSAGVVGGSRRASSFRRAASTCRIAAAASAAHTHVLVAHRQLTHVCTRCIQDTPGCTPSNSNTAFTPLIVHNAAHPLRGPVHTPAPIGRPAAVSAAAIPSLTHPPWGTTAAAGSAGGHTHDVYGWGLQGWICRGGTHTRCWGLMVQSDSAKTYQAQQQQKTSANKKDLHPDTS
jgi:hypothetical protein